MHGKGGGVTVSAFQERFNTCTYICSFVLQEKYIIMKCNSKSYSIEYDLKLHFIYIYFCVM